MLLCLDHLWPRGHRLRDNDARRLVTSCFSCNSKKKAMRLAAWLRELRSRGMLEAAMVRLRHARSVVIDRMTVRAHSAREALAREPHPDGAMY
jgi:hypothetical protein